MLCWFFLNYFNTTQKIQLLAVVYSSTSLSRSTSLSCSTSLSSSTTLRCCTSPSVSTSLTCSTSPSCREFLISITPLRCNPSNWSKSAMTQD